MKKIFLLISPLFLYLNALAQEDFNIVNYGAVPGLAIDNTQALQKAIDAANRVGKGRVLVPNGQFVTGPVELKSGVELYLSAGAELLGSTNRLAYGKQSVKALINAHNQHDIAISGKGTINGRGREVVKDLIKLLHEGVLADETWTIKRPSEQNRPRLIAFVKCNNISVRNLTLKNSAGWVQDFVACNRINIDSVIVESTEYWNNDGIDIVNSKDVRITNCNIDAADDGICLKSEGNFEGICENVYVENCIIRSSASGFKLGTGSYGGFRNIKVRNLNVYNTYRSAIALEAVDGGFIDQVDIENVTAKYTGNAIFIRLGHRNKTDQYSTIKNIRIAKVRAEIPNAKPDAGYPLEGPLPKVPPHNLIPASITGIPGHLVENVSLEDIDITYGGGASKALAYIPLNDLAQVTENEAGYPEFSMFGELPSWAFYVRHAKGISFKNVKFKYEKPDFRPAMVFDDVKKLSIIGLKVASATTKPVVALRQTTDHNIKEIKLPFNDKDAILELH